MLNVRSLIALAVLSCLVSSQAVAATKKTKLSNAKQSSHASARPQAGGKAKRTTTASRTRSSRGRRATVSSAASPRQSTPSQDRYREIQQALAERGYYDGPVDGVWTASSVVALRHFQMDQNLDPDGKLGALSLIALGLGPKRTPLQMTSAPEPMAGNGTPLMHQQPYLGKPVTGSSPTN